MKYIAGILIACVCLLAPTVSDALEDEFFEARVQRVVSGDRVILRGGTVIQYAGIVAPNPRDPRPIFSQQAASALAANERFVKDKTIRIECVEERYGVDTEKTAYVFSSGVFVNGYLVKQGLAVVNDLITPQDKYYSYLIRVQSEAKQARRGVWANAL